MLHPQDKYHPHNHSILGFSLEEGGQNMDLFSLLIQRTRPDRKTDLLERASWNEFGLPMVYFKFSMQIPRLEFGNANEV